MPLITVPRTCKNNHNHLGSMRIYRPPSCLYMVHRVAETVDGASQLRSVEKIEAGHSLKRTTERAIP
jgi:hypothetical protein